MIDTSVLVAGLTQNHEFHALARPSVLAAASGRIPGIVLAETWAVLRRAPWNLDPATVEQALSPWIAEDRIVATPAGVYVAALRQGRALNLGGNIHDLLIAYTCASADLALATLDRRQATLARMLPDLTVTLLLADAPISEGKPAE
ncbi:MAG: PIN domain-containing protein [Dehalococcoidia bacterium]|nr:PIN domain-containing protein [Dehalococcoidia bacterium]